MHGSCLRAVAYDWFEVGKSNPLKAESLYTFGVGKHIELMLVDWCKEMGIFAAHNVKFFNPDFGVSGELDLVLKESPGSPILYGVECKTSYGDYFKTEVITGRAGKPPAPKEEHVMQVMMYLDNFPTLPYFRLVYIGRDRFDRTEYIVRLKEIEGDKYPEITYPDGSNMVNLNLSLSRIYNRYVDTKKYVTEGTLPPRDYTPEMTAEEIAEAAAAGKISKAKVKAFERGELKTADWRCRYCNHKDLCRGMEDDEVKDFVPRYKKGEFCEVDYSKPNDGRKPNKLAKLLD
jgi:hypothetical protein